MDIDHIYTVFLLIYSLFTGLFTIIALSKINFTEWKKPEWICLWACNWQLRLKACEHLSQLNGFSPKIYTMFYK